MFRFIHVADGQMGMMAHGLGPAAAKVRSTRVEALANVLTLAESQRADAILIAGDLFEDNQVSRQVVEQVAGLLNDKTRTLTYILPGNHDPFSRDSVYRRPIWAQLRPHVKILATTEPVTLAAGVTLLPCPLTRKNGMDDPTALIPPRTASNGLRIALAHGTMRIRPDVGDDDFPIPLNAADLRGLDYLALGHWHSTLSDGSGRVWYSGTFETTGFGERDSGNALIVTLGKPGQPPHVETARTGVLSWLDDTVDLDTCPLAQATQKFRELPEAPKTLLRLKLRGQMDANTAAGLPDLKAVLTERFIYATVDESGLRPTDLEEGLASMATSPHLKQTATELLMLAQGQSIGTASPATARRALQILGEIAWEKRNA